MKSLTIKLDKPEYVKSFVHITGQYNYPVSLRAGRHTVDAHSLLGIFSLDITRPMTMEVYDDNCKDLIDAVRPYVVA